MEREDTLYGHGEYRRDYEKDMDGRDVTFICSREPADDWIRGVDDMRTAAQMMVMRAHHGDVIFTVGAGDITQMDPVILHALEAHRWDCAR